MEESITLSRWNYDSMCNENRELKEKVNELESALHALQDNDGQKVIIRETYSCENEDGDECVSENTSVKGFNEVKEEVKKLYKDKIEESLKETEQLKAEVEALKQNAENQKETASALVNRALEAEMEVSRLKHRNLWQRILNK